MTTCLGLLLAAVLVVGPALTSAQQQNLPHPLSALPPSGSLITSYYLPEHANKKFPAGETIKVVVGLHNDANDVQNVSAILGSLNLVSDFRSFVQNFTEQVYHQPVAGGEEISIEYKFVPDYRLDARDFIVALTVFYSDSTGNIHSNTFFNQTISVVEVKKLIDWELIFLFVFMGALVAGVGYVIYGYAAPHLQTMGIVRKGKKTKKVESAKTTSENHDEWVKGTNYDNFQKRKAKAASAAQKTPPE